MPVADGWGIPVADTATPGGFYVALNGASGRVGPRPELPGRIVHTPDAGATWTVLPFPDVAVRDLVAHGDALAAVTDDGLYLSQDAGQRWRRVAPAWDGLVYGTAFAGDDLLIATYDGIYRIADVLTGGSEVTQPYVTTDYTRPAPGRRGRRRHGGLRPRRRRLARPRRTAGRTWAEGADTGQSYVTVTTLTDGTVYASGLSSYSTSSDKGATWQTHPLPVQGPLATDVDHWPGAPPRPARHGDGGRRVLHDRRRRGVDQGRCVRQRRPGVHAGFDADGEPVHAGPSTSRACTSSRWPTSTPDAQDWGSIGAEGWSGRQLTHVAQSPLGDHDVWAVGTNAFGGGRILTAGAGESDADLAQVGPTGGFSPTALAVSPHDEDTLAVGYTSIVDTGLMVSRDGFETWTSYDARDADPAGRHGPGGRASGCGWRRRPACTARTTSARRSPG